MIVNSRRSVIAAICCIVLASCSGEPDATGPITATCDAVEGSLLDTASDTFGGPTNDGQVQWALEGCAVRTDMVFDVRGDDHCQYGDVRMISIGRPLGERVGDDWSDLYLWNPNGVVPGFPETRTIDVSEIPADTENTELFDGTHELWIADDRSAIYLVAEGEARVLPLDQSTEAANCA